MAFQMRTFTDDETIRRVWDTEDIKNLIGRWTYYEAANRRAEALERFWVARPENQATASFGRNWGFYTGMDSIREYYVNRCRFGAAGTGTMHPFSTKLLCLAEDGQTAQGLWMGIGYDTAPDSSGRLQGMWVNERMAIDFLKEDGAWKLWHVFIGTNFTAHAGEDYTRQPLRTQTRRYREGNPAWYMIGKDHVSCEVAEFDQILDYPEREAFGAPTHPCQTYTALYNDQIWFPHLPVDYRTFSETTGYDYAGFCAASHGSEGRVL